MSPVLTAPPEAPPRPPPERPGYLAIVWAAFLGYVCTLMVGFPLAVLTHQAGLNMAGVINSEDRGVFARYDVGSWAAEACVGLLAVGLTSLLVGHLIRTRTGWEVPFGFTFVTLLITGYAPLLVLTPLYGAGAASFWLAAFVLRWRLEPSGAEPRTPLVRSRSVTAGSSL